MAGAAGFRTPASGICIPLASLLWCLAEQFAPPAWRNSCPRRVAKEDELFRVYHVRVSKEPLACKI